MTFPLSNSPGTIVFLDDDPDYLEMLALVLPRHWHVLLFLRPQDCINHLQQEPPLWEADAWDQQRVIDHWRESGAPLIPQVLRYWQESSRRFSLARVCVVDYSMPAMDGLQALGELVEWPGCRVLLTGQADEQLAVDAFNRGLIDQFVPKQTPNISKHLIEVIKRLLATSNSPHAQAWRSTLSPRQNALLRVPSVALALSEQVAERQWVEYVTLGSPFGVLGVDVQGHASWLQLEPFEGLAELAELAATEGVDAGQLEAIRSGEQLPDIELRQSLGRASPPALAPAFAVGREELLLGAIFPIAPEHVPDPTHTFSQWLARQAPRRVKD